MEAVAYTWFNRFAALRYMEIHDYLSHGYRVLSSREGGLPEILNAAPELAQNRELPDLNPQQVIELKLAGDQDGELYRLTLIAQCNALSSVMPFLFERIDNETELLLPDNLLLTDSVIAKLVEAIPEEDWQQVEIIGWLYQFYISEKKDQVIGKVVKSEDIPAATQLFTPNWIVKYLVQNSVGRLWTDGESSVDIEKSMAVLHRTRRANAGSTSPIGCADQNSHGRRRRQFESRNDYRTRSRLRFWSYFGGSLRGVEGDLSGTRLPTPQHSTPDSGKKSIWPGHR